ncbi:MAG: ROK family protein [Candidatus Caldarchaeum sp.]
MDAVAIDIGATYTRLAVVDSRGAIIRKLVFSTPATQREISQQLKRAFEILHRSGVSKNTPVGAATIGPLSLSEGKIVKTPNLGGIDIELKKIVQKYHRGDFVMLNDCTAAAWAEKKFGLGRDVKNLVYITLSTGIGGGAIVDNHLLIGKEGNAVEIGHIVVDAFSSVKCGCGGVGHWEALCSGTGLPKLAHSIHGRKIWRSSREIFEAAKQRDRRAVVVLEKMSLYNAAGLASVINCFDPEIVLVGGGLALSHPYETLYKPVKILAKYRMLDAKIELTSLRSDAPLLGAASYAMNLHES